MRLTIIGCSGSMSGPESPASAYLVQAEGMDANGAPRTYTFTLDFGPGAMGHLLRYTDPALVDAMVISHLHADHCADLIGMQVYRRWHPSGPLPRGAVYSPGDARRRARQLGDDGPEETYDDVFDFRQVRSGDTFRIGPMTIQAFPALHTVEAFAYRITGPSDIRPGENAVLTFTGDTDMCDGVVAAARGADLLLSECAYEDGRDTVRGIHLTGSRAGALAAQAGAHEMLLTHLQPWTDRDSVRAAAQEEYEGRVACVRAGEAFRI